jgi:hypothetical protein
MSILDALSPYKLLAEIVVIGSLAAGAAYGVHQFLEHERQIGRNEVQARWEAQKVVDALVATKQEKDWLAKYDDAINQGAKNVQIARAAAATANSAADSLRNTSSDILKLMPGASAETARAYAAAYGSVFDKCVGRYKAMGEAAQGHANDAQTLSNAWPTKLK